MIVVRMHMLLQLTLTWRATNPPTNAPMRANVNEMPATSIPNGVPHSFPS